MLPREFLETWGYDLREQLPYLTGKSRSTINHWLQDPGSPSHRDPDLAVIYTLSYTHHLWELRRQIDADPFSSIHPATKDYLANLEDSLYVGHLWAIYDLIADRDRNPSPDSDSETQEVGVLEDDGDPWEAG